MKKRMDQTTQSYANRTFRRRAMHGGLAHRITAWLLAGCLAFSTISYSASVSVYADDGESATEDTSSTSDGGVVGVRTVMRVLRNRIPAATLRIPAAA